MSGDERRSQILHVAIKLFSQNGFRGTTTKEIARAAGVSEAMVFRHFATKEELYHAILDYKACEGEAAGPCDRIDSRHSSTSPEHRYETMTMSSAGAAITPPSVRPSLSDLKGLDSSAWRSEGRTGR